MKRREFVTAAASVAFVPSSTAGPYQDPAYLRVLARRTLRDRYERGGIASVGTALRHVRRIKPALDGRDARLQAAASELAAEAVWTLNDVRRFDVGENVGGLALELARRSGDPDAHSKACSALARVRHHRGDAGGAVQYALQGARLPEVPDEQQHWMTVRLAESLSMVPGQEGAARDVLEDLRATLADAERHAELAPHDVADVTGNVGLVLYELGAFGEAQACLDEAVRGLGSAKPLLVGYSLARQVTASLRAGQVGFAAERMIVLARVAPLVESVRLDAYLREVLALSGRWNAVPEIGAARAQLRTVLESGNGTGSECA